VGERLGAVGERLLARRSLADDGTTDFFKTAHIGGEDLSAIFLYERSKRFSGRT
jgi:hypothetical protein